VVGSRWWRRQLDLRQEELLAPAASSSSLPRAAAGEGGGGRLELHPCTRLCGRSSSKGRRHSIPTTRSCGEGPAGGACRCRGGGWSSSRGRRRAGAAPNFGTSPHSCSSIPRICGLSVTMTRWGSRAGHGALPCSLAASSACGRVDLSLPGRAELRRRHSSLFPAVALVPISDSAGGPPLHVAAAVGDLR
jgi:hypothetical protein